MLVLLGFSIHLELTSSFVFVFLSMGLLIFIVPFIVREPVIKVKRSDTSQDEVTSNTEKVKILTHQVIELIKSDSRYVLCFFGMSIAKLINGLTVWFMLFLDSFVESGKFNSDEDVKIIYKNLMTFATFITLCLLFPIGKLADIIPVYTFISLAFLVRGFFSIQFQFIDDPNSYYCAFVLSGFCVGSFA